MWYIQISDDSTKTTQLKRKLQGNYIEIECPDSIRMYDMEIGGFDLYNKFMLLFSVKNHIFKNTARKLL